jgi:hypothetical protein
MASTRQGCARRPGAEPSSASCQLPLRSTSPRRPRRVGERWFEANQRLLAADPTGGRDRQWTILEVPRVLEDAIFRRALLAEVRDRQVLDSWRTFNDALDRRFQLEIINPVQTKTYKFAANLTARAIVGRLRA